MRRHLPFILACVAIIAAAALVLLWMGRVPICTCGRIMLWAGDINSADNSQHLTDWYTPSHIAHGLLFYGALWLVARRWPMGLRATAALVVEAAWEIVENSPFVIDRYRQGTIASLYEGDSVINSVADMAAMLIGFWLAARLPLWASIALLLAMELFVGWMIRDNLTLNIIMLLYPLDAIRAWQTGGG